jgi:hypothetical protein
MPPNDDGKVSDDDDNVITFADMEEWDDRNQLEEEAKQQDRENYQRQVIAANHAIARLSEEAKKDNDRKRAIQEEETAANAKRIAMETEEYEKKVEALRASRLPVGTVYYPKRNLPPGADRKLVELFDYMHRIWVKGKPVPAASGSEPPR